MIKTIIISMVSFLLFTVITPPLMSDNYKVCYALFAKAIPNSTTGVAVIRTIDRYRFTNTPGKDFVDWNLKLEDQKDLLKLFVLFMGKSHLTVDETIWEFIKIAFQIRHLERRSLISLADGAVYKVLADIIGFGDIYTLIDNVINHDDSSWYHTLSLWNREELIRTLKEYKDLTDLIEALKTDKYNDKILSQLYSGNEVSTINDKDSVDSFISFTNYIITLVKNAPNLKNINKVIGTDPEFWKTFLSLHQNSTTQDVFFWYTFVESLKEKTVRVIKQTISYLDILYDRLGSIKKDSYRGSVFLKEHLASYLDVTATSILKLERLRVSVEAIDLKKSGISQKITNKKLVEAILGLVNRSLLRPYTNKSILLFFEAFFDLNNDLISTLQEEYMSLFAFYQKDPSKTDSIYKYFITSKYDSNYIEYLKTTYGAETVEKLLELLAESDK